MSFERVAIANAMTSPPCLRTHASRLPSIYTGQAFRTALGDLSTSSQTLRRRTAGAKRFVIAYFDRLLPNALLFAYDQRGFRRTPRRARGARTAGRAGASSVRREYPYVPVFLMGHSMGGGLVLAFWTRTGAPPAKETLSMLAGVVASSPLVPQTFPASKVLRFIQGKASMLLPNILIDAPVAVEGEHLLANDYKHWPRNLPLLLVHGRADRITSFTAARELFDKAEAADGGFHELVHKPEGVKEKPPSILHFIFLSPALEVLMWLISEI
ncbi:Alpha/Beta hydrolase protein [Ganoderma leucocontextum]|nr:Alpha/Beta hydrolase protein [Ganoderma leucocontextum]